MECSECSVKMELMYYGTLSISYICLKCEKVELVDVPVGKKQYHHPNRNVYWD